MNTPAHRTLVGRCAAHWPILLSMVALSGLLVAFAQVVQEAVRRGDQRRAAVATHADGLSRCNVMSNQSQREHCHALLDAGTAEIFPSTPKRTQR